ncbi:hypothetical protein V2J09_014534 [Rumex salicifolius]
MHLSTHINQFRVSQSTKHASKNILVLSLKLTLHQQLKHIHSVPGHPVNRISRYHSCPRDRIPLGHSIKHLACIAHKTRFTVHIHKGTANKHISATKSLHRQTVRLPPTGIDFAEVGGSGEDASKCMGIGKSVFRPHPREHIHDKEGELGLREEAALGVEVDEGVGEEGVGGEAGFDDACMEGFAMGKIERAGAADELVEERVKDDNEISSSCQVFTCNHRSKQKPNQVVGCCSSATHSSEKKERVRGTKLTEALISTPSLCVILPSAYPQAFVDAVAMNFCFVSSSALGFVLLLELPEKLSSDFCLRFISVWVLGMAVAESSSFCASFSCFKVADLKDSILDANDIANLKDQYILGEQLGWGQFGIIRACTDRFTREVLACKSIAKERLVTQDDVRSIKLEIEIMSRLSGHPNVVDLKAVYEEEDFVHLVMELCAGGELFHQLEKQGRYSEVQAKVIFKYLMQVVTYCHDKGVVHRDLKPENILLATKASSSPIKLADFGLATYIKPGQSLHGTVGSPFYIAPEVLAGGYTQAADVWSAGVILYILLSGMPPFWGKTKSRIFDAVRAADLRFPSGSWDRVSESAKELIRKMLCKDPLKRITAQEVLDHLWMVEHSPNDDDESYKRQVSGESQLDCGGDSFSTPLMTRNQDISFGTNSPLISEPQSPTFTCKSSFSAFLVEPSTPFSLPGVLSFGGCNVLTADEFASPLYSVPSFTFFSPIFSAEPPTLTVDFSTNSAVCSGKLFSSPEPSLCLRQDVIDFKEKTSDSKRSGGGFGSSSRLSSIHNKRNRTIGLGEFDQLDLMVTESVIRWASCTHLPTTSSLLSSLVC